MHHRTFHINQPTRRNNFSSLLLGVYSYVQLNMFRVSSRPSSGAQQLQEQPLVLPLEHGGSSAVGCGRAGYQPDHNQQHCYHNSPTVKPEAATAVVELLMMGVRTPETCWAVHTSKRQVINLRSCCVWLVDLFESYFLLFCLTHFWLLKLAHSQSIHLPDATSYLFVSAISDGWRLHISSYFSSDSQFVMCWYRGCAHCKWGKGAEHRLQLPLFPRSKSSARFN